MSISSLRRKRITCGAMVGITEVNYSVVRMIAILALIVSCCQMVAADEFPTISLTDAPAPSSTSAMAPTPLSAPAPVPTDMGVTLDNPTITPTSISAVAPTATVASPTSIDSPISTPSAVVSVPSTTTTLPPATVPPTRTFQPTTTYFPTISPPPTITANPTSTACNICINGTVSINDLIVLDEVNVTCVEAEGAGMQGLISSINCVFLQQLLFDTNLCSCSRGDATVPPAPNVTYATCNICGDGYYVSNEEAELLLVADATDTVTCGFANQGGIVGILEPETCIFFQNQTSPLSNSTNSNLCGCMVGTMPPTPDTCNVCGNTTESVSLLDQIVNIPQEVLNMLPDAANISSNLFTCEFVEKNYNTKLDAFICEFIQMEVADVCQCQVPNVVESNAPVLSPIGSPVNNTKNATTTAPVPSPIGSAANTNNTSSLASTAQLHRWNAVVALSSLLFYIL